jgi:hypothetical protein
MNKIFRGLVVISTVALLSPAASATVLSFDDIGADGFLPGNYGGLSWVSDAWTVFGDVQAPYAAHSGDYRVTTQWDGSDTAASINFLTPSFFAGAYFSGYSEANVSFKLYLQGQLVATSASLAPSETATFLASGYTGLVDTVVVSSPAHSFFAMDDFTYSAPVPEPESYAMLLAGLGLLGFATRRTRLA